MYLQILAQHSLIKYDSTFKFFLTSEDTEEFEKLKNDPQQFSGESSIAVTSLKKLQLQDTFNFLYSTIKSRYFDKSEPQEIQTALKLAEICGKINKFLPILDKRIALLESRIAFNKIFASGNEDLASSLEDLQEEDPDLEKVINDSAEYHMKYGFLSKVLLFHSHSLGHHGI